MIKIDITASMRSAIPDSIKHKNMKGATSIVCIILLLCILTAAPASAQDVVWQYDAIIPWDAERLTNNNTLITEYGNHTVIEVNTTTSEIIWQYGTGIAGPDPGQLNSPVDAERLSNNNTLITDRNNHRVIEVNTTGAIVWQYGTTGTSGSGYDQLYNPMDAERLSNGNTLIADRLNNRVIEVNESKGVVWQYVITNPFDADRLSNGNTLIVEYTNHRVIEINESDEIVWQYGTGIAGSGVNQLNYPMDAERLANGNTLIVDYINDRVIEVRTSDYDQAEIDNGFTAKSIVWEHGSNHPADADRLSSGSTLISEAGNNSVIEVAFEIDLVPTAIEALSPYNNLTNTIQATILNNGTGDASSFNVSLSADGNPVDEVEVSGLDAGGSTVVSLFWTPSATGDYELCVTADCDLEVDESDEDNNLLCENVTVLSFEHPCYNDTFDGETKIAGMQHVVVSDGDVEIDDVKTPNIWRPSSVDNGLVTSFCNKNVGAYPGVSMAFNITGDGRWDMLMGSIVQLQDAGYYWNGSQWVSNPSLLSGLSEFHKTAMAFNITGDGRWNLIIIATELDVHYEYWLEGYYWNGTQWISEPSLVEGLELRIWHTIASIQPAIAFNITGDGRWNLLLESVDSYGYYWNGSQWVSDPLLSSGLPGGAQAVAFNVTGDGRWNLFSGTSGYYWNGSQWVYNSSIGDGLGGRHPGIAFNVTGDEKWNMITGFGNTQSSCGWFEGFSYLPAPGYIISDTISGGPSFKNWAVFNANASVPPGTSITYEILDEENNTIMSVVDGQNISGITQPSIRLYAELSTNDLSKTPVLHDWSVCWENYPQNPDLTPTAINAHRLFVNQSNTVTATIANIGVLGASSFNVSLSADGDVVGNASVPSLGAGNSMTVSFNWTPAWPGNHELCVVADPDEAIEEINETNNGKCIIVAVEDIGWHYAAAIPWDTERLTNNNTLVTEFGNHAVIEVTPSGEIVWQYGTGIAGSGEGQLSSPVDAERLASGTTLITDSENHRVIEVNSTGGIVWQYGNGTPGAGADQLNHPMDAEKLLNDNVLIADEHNNRVIEVAMNKTIMWQMTQGLDHPADAKRLSSGNTLIADHSNHRVIEVNSTGGIVWQYGTTGVSGSWINELNCPADAERLSSGNTLIADYSNHRVIEVSIAKKIVGQYGTGTAGLGNGELNCPADAERLFSDNTLIADTGNNRVIEVIKLPLPAPKIVSFAPPSPVYDVKGAVRSFNITTDQIVDVSWLKNNLPVQTDAGVTGATYTNTNASVGTWNVLAVVSNANGTAMQTWDWKVRSFLGPDLIVSAIDAYHNNTGFSPYFNLSNEIDVEVENTGIADAGAFNVSLYVDDEFIEKQPVADMGPGNTTTVQFIWTPIGLDCEDGGSQQTYTLKAIADCDNDAVELNEANNESTTQETVYWAGYSADEHINAIAWHGMLHGGLHYTTGDGSYAGLYSPGNSEDTVYSITLPDGASIELARLNVYYTWSKVGTTGVYPVMEVRITNTSGTYLVASAAEYNDRPCVTPAIAFEYPFGNYVYDLTPYITGDGSYTVNVKNVGPAYYSFCIAAPGLVILYEDDTKPEHEFWILEGADLLEGGRRGGAGYLDLSECICNATFTGDIDTDKVDNATLGIVSAWGGTAWGADWTSYYWFNDHYLGDGSMLGGYSSLYDKTVNGISMYAGASGNAQVGMNVSDVTSYIASDNNTLSFGDDGDSMMAANAFLALERGAGTSPAPLLIYGYVNYPDGNPANDSDVVITNLNTPEMLAVETATDLNYYQVVTSSCNVSMGDVLNFNASNGNSIKFNHTVTPEEMDDGCFTQNLTVGHPGICGDVNGDGDADMTDVMTLWYDIADYPYAGAYTISDAWAADVNCDGDVDMTDVMTLWYDIADYPHVGAYEVNCC